MRFISVVSIFVLVVVAISTAYAPNGGPQYDLEDAPLLFEKFIRDYNRHYKDEEDYFIHYAAFFKNLIEINKMNAESSPGGAIFDINLFADFTDEEKRHLLGLKTSSTTQGPLY